MKAIQDLRMEHDAVRLTLKVLERVAQKIERDGSLDTPQHVYHLLEFFTIFVDKCHHGKEEELRCAYRFEAHRHRHRQPCGDRLQRRAARADASHCDDVYDPEIDDTENGIAPWTAFEDLPQDWLCPGCSAGKDLYEKVE